MNLPFVRKAFDDAVAAWNQVFAIRGYNAGITETLDPSQAAVVVQFNNTEGINNAGVSPSKNGPAPYNLHQNLTISPSFFFGSPQLLFTTMLHELGHVFGFDQTTVDVSIMTVMYRWSISSFVLVAALSAVPSAQVGKPEQIEVLHTDYSGPVISTFSQLAQLSDAIVIGTVTDLAYVDSDVYLVDTRYHVLPLEVLKKDSHGSPNLAWSVIVHGGKKEEKKVVRVIEYKNGPKMVIGKKYVMFLRWVEELHAYMFIHGSDSNSVVEVRENGTLKVANKSSLSTRASKMSLSMLRTEIQAAPR